MAENAGACNFMQPHKYTIISKKCTLSITVGIINKKIRNVIHVSWRGFLSNMDSIPGLMLLRYGVTLIYLYIIPSALDIKYLVQP